MRTFTTTRRNISVAGKKCTADLVVYGATPSGITAAIQAARDGLAVVLIGGWRDKHLGGMMSGGLGFTDFRKIDAFGGLARAITVKAANGGTAKNPFAFKPSAAEGEFKRLLDAEGVPFLRSTGVTKVVRRGARIQEIHTGDDQIARGRVFIDASYEGDLMALSGVSYFVGRDQADEKNRNDGYRGGTAFAGGSEQQFHMKNQFFDVDPFIVHGNPASGYLPTVGPKPQYEVGSPDKAVQAYNFRMMMTDQIDKRQDFSAEKPKNYDPLNYELLIRYIAAIEAAGMRYGQDYSFSNDLIAANAVSAGIYDVNAINGFSTDLFGGNWLYPNASYSDREKIWQAHKDFTKGFFYTLAWHSDPRLPAALQVEARRWGFVKTEFQDPHLNDEAGWPYQLYIRESRRLNNGLFWSGADLEASAQSKLREGTAVAMASYFEDSHHVQRIAIPTSDGGWKVWNEGNLFSSLAGGANLMSPLPFELMLPKKEHCSNLLVTFCVAASHQAFSAIRIELTSMTLGQVAGAASALACASSSHADFYSVEMADLQTKLSSLGVVFEEPSRFSQAMTNLSRRIDA